MPYLIWEVARGAGKKNHQALDECITQKFDLKWSVMAAKATNFEVINGYHTTYSLIRLNPLFKTRKIHVLIQAFLNVFPQLSPTQVGKILSFSAHSLRLEFFFKKNLSLFKRMEDFPKFPGFPWKFTRKSSVWAKIFL